MDNVATRTTDPSEPEDPCGRARRILMDRVRPLPDRPLNSETASHVTSCPNCFALFIPPTDEGLEFFERFCETETSEANLKTLAKSLIQLIKENLEEEIRESGRSE